MPVGNVGGNSPIPSEGGKAVSSENGLTSQASGVDAFFGAFMKVANNLTDVPVTEVEIGQAMGSFEANVSESNDAYMQQQVELIEGDIDSLEVASSLYSAHVNNVYQQEIPNIVGNNQIVQSGILRPVGARCVQNIKPNRTH